MRELTQTVVGENGNCWQTCIACVLDVDPVGMPDQSTIERVTGRDERGKFVRAGSYHNPLAAYLRDHHALVAAHVYSPLHRAVRATTMGGLHLAYGETVRTPTLGTHHVVVARDGETVWDPHPSRDGLTKVTGWGVFAPWPDEWDLADNRRLNPCVCPRCATD
jgi:hypothetical protein